MDALALTGVVIKEEDNVFASLCLELDVASAGESAEEAKNALFEAVILYIETAIESNLPFIRLVPPDEDPRRQAPDTVVTVFPFKVNVAIQAYA
ncbi:MAG: hypothetical protein HY260_05900 [Chloroflexi bacterium]|nr:hypothetical protein [Chloroflexota bacterium]